MWAWPPISHWTALWSHHRYFSQIGDWLSLLVSHACKFLKKHWEMNNYHLNISYWSIERINIRNINKKTALESLSFFTTLTREHYSQNWNAWKYVLTWMFFNHFSKHNVVFQCQTSSMFPPIRSEEYSPKSGILQH